MTGNDLEVFFTGTYQLGQSVSYLADVLDGTDAISEKSSISPMGNQHSQTESLVAPWLQ